MIRLRRLAILYLLLLTLPMLCAAEQTGNQVLVIPHTHWEGAEIRKLLAEGRLAIAGGTDTMHDNNIPSGESIVRQYLYGKTYFREKLG